jgi:hypothetical protein
MKVSDKIKQEESKLSFEKRLVEKFPDVETTSKGKYHSKMVNSIATDIDYWHSCGCCYDAALYAAPYVEFEGKKIYSSPIEITIGEHYSWTESVDENWEQLLQKHNISSQAIDRFRPQVLKWNKEKLSVDNEDDYEDDDI